MKIKEGFILKNIAGNYVVVPVGKEAIRMKALINLNESSAFLWKQLEIGIEKEDLIQSLMNEYAIDHALASKDTQHFIKVLIENKIVEDDE